MDNYDLGPIQTLAEKFRMQSERVIFQYPIWGFFLGGLIGLAPVLAGALMWITAIFLLAVTGMFVGIAWGRRRSLDLRFRVELILIQKQIERNTER